MLKPIAILTILLAMASAKGQQIQPLDINNSDTLARLLQKYNCHDLKGNLAVFGTLFNEQSKPVSVATVELRVNGAGRGPYQVNEDGTYCIRYDKTKTITELVFGITGLPDTCVTQISGEQSHYINKVFAKACFPQSSSLKASVLSHSDTKSLGSLISQEYLVVQMIMVIPKREDLRLLTAGFETTVSLPDSTSAASSTPQKQSAPSIQPVDPQLLIAMAKQQRDLANLLRVGPFVLLAIQKAPSVNVALLQSLAFRQNEIVPSGTAITRIVFVPRSSLSLPFPDTTKGSSTAMAALGTLVVKAQGLSSGEEFKFTSGFTDVSGNSW